MAAPRDTSAYRVEHIGPWTAADIRVRFDPAEFRPPGDRLELIRQAWQAEQADARRRGFEMFNGKLARMMAATANERGLDLELQPTDFRTFLVTHVLKPERFSDAERANAMGVSAIIRSADARLVFGRRSQRVAANRGKLHTVGGVLDWIRPSGAGARGEPASVESSDGVPQWMDADGGWLFDQLGKELNEEIGLEPEEITRVTAMALVRDQRIGQPELVCLAEVGLAGDELFERWRQTGEYEHADLWGCHDSPEALAEAVAEKAGEFTPIAIAAASAYLQMRQRE